MCILRNGNVVQTGNRQSDNDLLQQQANVAEVVSLEKVEMESNSHLTVIAFVTRVHSNTKSLSSSGCLPNSSRFLPHCEAVGRLETLSIYLLTCSSAFNFITPMSRTSSSTSRSLFKSAR